jgi:hypothetical protein
MKTRPRIEPAIRVEILWTMVPNVMPAKPLTLFGSSLSREVNEPVYSAIKRSVGIKRVMVTYTVALLIKKFN